MGYMLTGLGWTLGVLCWSVGLVWGGWIDRPLAQAAPLAESLAAPFAAVGTAHPNIIPPDPTTNPTHGIPDISGISGTPTPITSQLSLTGPTGTLSVTVESQRGGRITAFAWDGATVLQGPDVDPQNYGSTLWVSPQSRWGWPPSASIDRSPYRVIAPNPLSSALPSQPLRSCDDPTNGTAGPVTNRDVANRDGVNPTIHPNPSNSLTLTSAPSPEWGVQVTKTLELSLRSDQIPQLLLTYDLKNCRQVAVTYAPWEVSRVSAGGLSFYGAQTLPFGVEPFPMPVTQQAQGIVWWDHRRSGSIDQQYRDQKLFGDAAEGWLAHLDGALLFLKQFEDVGPADQAPGEGEIEIYVNGDRTYVEMEVQGPYRRIEPGESLRWQVKWSLHPLPPALAGSAADDRSIAKWVRRLVLG